MQQEAGRDSVPNTIQSFRFGASDYEQIVANLPDIESKVHIPKSPVPLSYGERSLLQIVDGAPKTRRPPLQDSHVGRAVVRWRAWWHLGRACGYSHLRDPS